MQSANKINGFTLIEMMFSVAIAAGLLLLAQNLIVDSANKLITSRTIAGFNVAIDGIVAYRLGTEVDDGPIRNSWPTGEQLSDEIGYGSIDQFVNGVGNEYIFPAAPSDDLYPISTLMNTKEQAVAVALAMGVYVRDFDFSTPAACGVGDPDPCLVTVGVGVPGTGTLAAGFILRDCIEEDDGTGCTITGSLSFDPDADIDFGGGNVGAFSATEVKITKTLHVESGIGNAVLHADNIITDSGTFETINVRSGGVVLRTDET